MTKLSRQTIALFGEAEKGEIGTPLFMKSITHLSETLGHPPYESRGIFFAVQFLLYEQEVIFIRVKEEGFSTKDYLKGMNHLLSKKEVVHLTAVCLPGVGDARIIDAVHPVTDAHGALVVTTEKDLYDYLTSMQLPNL
ncbi:hypothetical protein [Candidatus Neptunochlamydia vexilliferae]|uniref:Uncharacterized protein n=1 Tax=Candidatus Neptunichlamydia vexilliferae TaxID=1651774 RepID=A0ABS0AYU6_9BACT|nr:hypothetical protein [Candidatus Neptunochlamydia vexilliferae]MBF5059139.1 hypothetical protein [Candidatus Neptunochlamydia vexilliferae]